MERRLASWSADVLSCKLLESLMVNGRIEQDYRQLKNSTPDKTPGNRRPRRLRLHDLSKTIETRPWNEIATKLPVDEFESALVQSLMQTLNLKR
jgi:hypothetical protein